MNDCVQKYCRDLAKQIIEDQYCLIDEIWSIRVNYHTVAPYYDAATIKTIMRLMPNLIVKVGGSPLDELAYDYGFSSTCELMEKFLNYTNKKIAFENYYKLLIDQYDGTLDVPF